MQTNDIMQSDLSLDKLIKQELRTMMNGIAAAQMRDAGGSPDYTINYGIEMPRLIDYAASLDTSRADLATYMRLWHSKTRECRLLCCILMDKKLMDLDLALEMANDILSAELAAIASMYLFAKMKDAMSFALRLIASDNKSLRLVGYYTALHTARNKQISDRTKDELLDQASTDLNSEDYNLRKAAHKIVEMPYLCSEL